MFSLENIEFSEEDIVKIFKNIEPNLSCGPDGIPGIVFNKCVDVLAIPLTLIWRKSIKNGICPLTQKRSLVIPGLKPGSNRSDPASYSHCPKPLTS